MASISGKMLRSSAALLNISVTRSYALPADPLARFKAIANATDERHRVLITGALGQLGRGLNTVYKYMYGDGCVVMTDIIKAPRNATDISNYSYLDILSQDSIERLVVDKHIDTVVHFSALLSAVGEQNVNLALKINCRGVENVLEVARKHDLKVFIPSTIGAFGPTTPRDNVPDLTIQEPTTIYGVSKVYAERLGEYYHHKFGVDFRCLRFPGIISATKPGGGTTDSHTNLRMHSRRKHICYLSAGYQTSNDVRHRLHGFCRTVPLGSIGITQASNIQRDWFLIHTWRIANAVMPHFKINYDICKTRQAIADSWPRSLDDSGAKKDWGWHVEYGLDETVEVMFSPFAGQRDC
ncbi:NAD dependent epimerase/dehydratase family protein [Cooperia oncophora]